MAKIVQIERLGEGLGSSGGYDKLVALTDEGKVYILDPHKARWFSAPELERAKVLFPEEA